MYVKILRYVILRTVIHPYLGRFQQVANPICCAAIHPKNCPINFLLSVVPTSYNTECRKTSIFAILTILKIFYYYIIVAIRQFVTSKINIEVSIQTLFLSSRQLESVLDTLCTCSRLITCNDV